MRTQLELSNEVATELAGAHDAIIKSLEGHLEAEVCPRCLPPLAEAVAIYRDDFMAGFGLRDSVAFDDWQFFQAEGLRRDLAGALERLMRLLSARGEFEAAVAYGRRRLALDPLH